MDGYFNPYMNPYLNPYQYQAQKHEQNVVRVSGYEGAKNYAMGPNSSVFLLDESGILIWCVTTDGAGYKTIHPYDISPHQEPPKPEESQLTDILNKLNNLEARMNELTSNFTATKQTGVRWNDDSSDSK